MSRVERNVRTTMATLLLVGAAFSCAKSPAPLHSAESQAPAKAAAPIDPEAWRSATPNAGAPREVPYPAATEQRLANGLRLYIAQRPSPVVNLSVVVRAGVSSLAAGKSGLHALAARMLTEGTTKKSALQLALAAETLGSDLSEEAERDSISIGMQVLPRDVPLALQLLAEVLLTPAFGNTDLQRVKKEWKDQLTADRQNPARLSSLAGLRAVLGPVLGAPVSGSAQDVETLTRADLISWHRAQVVPAQTAVTLVGNVDAAAVTAQATALFGKWAPAGPAATQPPAAPQLPGHTRVILIDRPGAVQSAVFAVQPFPKRSEPGHEAREVMSSLFGGLFTSRLNLNLREKHAYTYGARSTLVATRQFGLFALSTSVERDVTADAIEQMLFELKALLDPALNHPITGDEIQRAKADLAQDLGASLEDVGRVANNVAHQFVHDLPLDYFAQYKGTLAQLTAAQISQAAHSIDLNKFTIVVTGDRAAIEEKLKQKGLLVELATPNLLE